MSLPVRFSFPSFEFMQSTSGAAGAGAADSFSKCRDFFEAVAPVTAATPAEETADCTAERAFSLSSLGSFSAFGLVLLAISILSKYASTSLAWAGLRFRIWDAHGFDGGRKLVYELENRLLKSKVRGPWAVHAHTRHSKGGGCDR